MKLVDLVRVYSWPEVEATLLELYPEEQPSLTGYKQVYEELQKLSPVPSETSISVEAVETETDKYIDVTGYNQQELAEVGQEKSTRWGLAFAPWQEWLAMEIIPETVANFSGIEVLAHCLWEMTFHGFDQAEIRKVIEDIDRVRNEALEKIIAKEKFSSGQLKTIEDLEKEIKKKRE